VAALAAGILDIATEDVRQFVKRNLDSIGTTMGIKQAQILADIMVAKTGITVWEEIKVS
jgi:hypothetical protein